MSDKVDVQILVVEDEPDWSEALAKMYKSIFRSVARPVVMVASEGATARTLLQKRRYDLLSCDINLSSSASRRGDVDGRAVLRFAAENRKAGAVIVPTGAAFDAELQLAIPDKTEIQRVRLTSYLQELFPKRVLRLDKAQGLTAEVTVAEWARAYGDQIVALSNAWPSIRPPYTVFAEWPETEVRDSVLKSGTSDGALRVSIWGTGRPEKKYRVEHGSREEGSVPDAEFFLRLMMAYRDGECLRDSEVVAIYGGNVNDPRQPEILVGSLCRRLTKAGLDPDHLFVRQRGRGWRFAAANVDEIVGLRLTDRHDGDPVRVADRRQVEQELGVYVRNRGTGPDK